MRQQLWVIASVVLAACAPQAGTDTTNNDDDDVVDTRPDAGVRPPDAATAQPPPQPQPQPEPAGCKVTQLLANAAFDAMPAGTGWTQTLIDPQAPLVTDEDGVPERSAPYKAWLGGLTSALPGTTVRDVLFQDFMVPAGTTQLTITGHYDVRTAEDAGTVEYDKATVSLVKTDNTAITTMLSVSNLTPKTAWTWFGHVVPQDLSGQTVRLRITSTNDDIDATSFFFESLTLNAIHGCPAVQ
jgi:hypothetical protein